MLRSTSHFGERGCGVEMLTPGPFWMMSVEEFGMSELTSRPLAMGVMLLGFQPC